MKIKIEMEIESCKECPFHAHVREQGYSATECTKLPPYNPIAEKGFLPNCPFLQKKLLTKPPTHGIIKPSKRGRKQNEDCCTIN